MDVPAHVLMGVQRRPRIPFAYWTIDLPPDLLAQQIRYAAEELDKPEPSPVRRISTVVYPSGVRWSFSDEQVRHEAFYFGKLPGFVRGIHLEVEEDDGSQDFDKRFTECEHTPRVTG